MTPAIIVDVVSQKSEAAFATVEDFAYYIEGVFAEVDGHVEGLVGFGEVVHFVVEE